MRLTLYLLIQRFIDIFRSQKCYKESMGYNCHHRVYKDGNRECGGE